MSMYDGLLQRADKIFSSLPTESKHYILEYLNYQIQRQFSPDTVGTSIYAINIFFRQLDEDKQADISKITKRDVYCFVEKLCQLNRAPKTINQRLSVVSSFFTYMVNEDYVIKNPVLRHYYIEEEKRLPRPMEESDLKVFLNTLHNLHNLRDKAIFLLMLRCGLRVGEVARLRLHDIKWENKNLIVYNGKGKVDRVVYFSEDVNTALSLWLQKRREISSDYCFFSRYNHQLPISSLSIRRRMKELLEQCGLKDKGYTPHTLRHTFATQMLNAGIQLHILKELMGHRRMDQTLMYAKLSDQKIREDYKKATDKVEKEYSLS